MSAQIFYNNGSSSSEVITHLINSTDGTGLHFDGAAGSIDIASPPDLGTKFSFEFVIQADSWADSTYKYLIDFGVTGRFTIGTENTAGAKLAIQFGSTWEPFTVSPLDDLKVHHIVITISGDTVTLYDNGNSVSTIVNAGTHNIDACTSAVIGSYYSSAANLFNGTIYRARFWNKTLTAPEVTASYENATVPFADQYGSQTNKVASPDTNWGTDVANQTAFNAAYAWTGYLTSTMAVSSNVLTITTNADGKGMWADFGLTSGKRYRVTMATGAISGATYQIQTRIGSDYTSIGTLVASTTNTFEFTAPAGAYGKYLYFYQEGAGTGSIALTAASVTNELVAAGCVADYDLAFANPTQSLMVQDRAGAADGTSSATGVVQVTPIEQLNSRAASIGGVARTPAGGELLVSGKIGVGGVTQGDDLITVGDGTASDGNGVRIYSDRPMLRLHEEDQTDKNWQLESQGGDFKISTQNDAFTSAGTKLTIDSAGNVGIGCSPTRTLTVSSLTDGYTMQLENLSAYNSGEQAGVVFNGIYNAGGSVTDLASIRGGKDNTTDGNYGGKLAFFTRSNGGSDTARLTIDNTGLATFSNGIAFQSATTGSGTGTGYTLDSYEEGTWTPTLIGSTTSPTQSYADQNGRYTRVGRLVYAEFYIAMAASGVSAGVGYAKVDGFPWAFNSDASHGNAGVVAYGGSWLTSNKGAPTAFFAIQATNDVYLRSPNSSYPATTSVETSSAADVKNGTLVTGCITYHI